MATSDVAAFYAQMQIKFSPNRKRENRWKNALPRGQSQECGRF